MHTLRLTDVAPVGLTYVPGSLAVPQGVVIDTGSLLQWGDVVSDTRILDVTYAVTVTTGAVGWIISTVHDRYYHNGRIT